MSVSRPVLAFALSVSVLLAACGTASTNAPATSTPQKPAGSSSSPVPASTPQATASSDTSAGEALVNSRCTVCHTTDRIKAAKKSPDEWRSTVQRMVNRGAQLNAQEMDTVVKYLSERYK